MMRNLSEKEQKEFIDSIPTDKKYTQKQIEKYCLERSQKWDCFKAYCVYACCKFFANLRKMWE